MLPLRMLLLLDMFELPDDEPLIGSVIVPLPDIVPPVPPLDIRSLFMPPLFMLPLVVVDPVVAEPFVLEVPGLPLLPLGDICAFTADAISTAVAKPTKIFIVRLQQY